MASFLKMALVDHLNETHDGGAYGSIRPDDILDVEVCWDEGEENENEDYDLYPRNPSLQIKVKLSDEHHPGGWVQIDQSWLLTAMLQIMLQVGDLAVRQ